MQIVEAEIGQVLPVQPGTQPDYNRNNPVGKLLRAVEDVSLAADREHYLVDSVQYLFPVGSMALYGPSGDAWQVRDPRQQDNKNDFQKQNLRDLTLTGTQLVRGFAVAGKWSGPFLHIAHAPQSGSPLLGPGGVFPGPAIKLFLKVGANGTGQQLIEMPLNMRTQRYEVELWAADATALDGAVLGGKAQAARDGGALLLRPDLVRGSYGELHGAGFDEARKQARAQGRGVEMLDYAPEHSLHPLRPLRLELAFATADESAWDSAGGRNYRYEFSMSQRGWRSYLGVGDSSNPHGGIGTLEYRNLWSNYFGHEARRREIFGPDVLPELGRELPPWSFDADGRKPPAAGREAFLAVDYMDLHILRPNAIIGLHRHRDNQEVFMILQGKALMMVGDWALQDGRERAVEIRTMRPGDLAFVKGGGLHALANSLDEDVLLFMFGGYD